MTRQAAGSQSDQVQAHGEACKVGALSGEVLGGGAKPLALAMTDRLQRRLDGGPALDLDDGEDSPRRARRSISP